MKRVFFRDWGKKDFLIAAAMLAVIAPYLLYVAIGLVDDKSKIESTACASVTEVFHSNGLKGIGCEKVDLGEKLNPSFYQATAYLSTGMEIDVGVRVHDDGKLSVSFTP